MDAARHIANLLGANLKRARREADLSQEELGYRSSLHRTEISGIERGLRVIRVDTLVKLAGGLGIPPSELMRGIEWSPGELRRGSFAAAPGESNDGSGR
jgi:transcriptional regulator with XRE-family HTH domain